MLKICNKNALTIKICLNMQLRSKYAEICSNKSMSEFLKSSETIKFITHDLMKHSQKN